VSTVIAPQFSGPPGVGEALIQVDADIRRSDLIALACYAVPRQRGTWVLFTLLVFATLIFDMVYEGPLTEFEILITSLFGAIVGVVGVLARFVFRLVSECFFTSPNAGRLGPRVYGLDQDGFAWNAETGFGKQRWTAIGAVRKTSKLVVIAVTPTQFFIVPRRSFMSAADFDGFFAKASDLLKQHRRAA
jgi:hypothetical protein